MHFESSSDEGCQLFLEDARLEKQLPRINSHSEAAT